MHSRTCPIDGTTFETSSANKKYCSRRCARKAENTRYRTSASERVRCKGCGLGFQRNRGQRSKIYCSLECQYSTRSADYRERGIKPTRINDFELGKYYRALRADPCAYCGETGGVIDHVVPRSVGGENHWQNYTGVCQSCNSSKSNKPLLAFMGWRRAAREFVAWDSLAGNSVTTNSIIATAARAAG